MTGPETIRGGGSHHLFSYSYLFLDSSGITNYQSCLLNIGVPIVFPVFGPAPKEPPFDKLVQHGFARSVRWNLQNHGGDPAVAIFSKVSRTILALVRDGADLTI